MQVIDIQVTSYLQK